MGLPLAQEVGGNLDAIRADLDKLLVIDTAEAATVAAGAASQSQDATVARLDADLQSLTGPGGDVGEVRKLLTDILIELRAHSAMFQVGLNTEDPDQYRASVDIGSV